MRKHGRARGDTEVPLTHLSNQRLRIEVPWRLPAVRPQVERDAPACGPAQGLFSVAMKVFCVCSSPKLFSGPAE